MKSYDKIIPYEQYEKDYIDDIREAFKEQEKSLIERYVEAVKNSDEIKNVYNKRVEGFKKGQFDKLYVDSELYMHSMYFPDWE